MWKYIVIAALVLFAAAAFVFHKTHSGIVSSSGEVAALRSNAEAAVAKKKEIYEDKRISAYAQMRAEWIASEKAASEQKTSEFNDENTRISQETANLQQEYDSSVGVAANQKKELEQMVENIASRDDIKNLMDKLELESEEMDASDPELFDKIAANIKALEEKRKEIQTRLQHENSSLEVLVARKDDLTNKIADADALARERRSRISPAELVCHITTADSNWDYVILDKGLDGGIIIGSRLAVMRGDKKICELLVTLVEANRSSCDIVYNTLITGEIVRPGDRVISVRPATETK